MKAGDVVKLKSGGVKMTVRHINDKEPNEPDTAAVCWFENNSLQREAIPVVSLVVVPE